VILTGAPEGPVAGFSVARTTGTPLLLALELVLVELVLVDVELVLVLVEVELVLVEVELVLVEVELVLVEVEVEVEVAPLELAAVDVELAVEVELLLELDAPPLPDGPPAVGWHATKKLSNATSPNQYAPRMS
jgi:hypothetical protein